MLYIFPVEDSAHEAPLSPPQRLQVGLSLKETDDLPMMIHIVKRMHVMVMLSCMV
jgi:hypothetical protein